MVFSLLQSICIVFDKEIYQAYLVYILFFFAFELKTFKILIIYRVIIYSIIFKQVELEMLAL